MKFSLFRNVDAYSTTLSLTELFALVRSEKWHLHNLLIESTQIYFEAPISDYWKISKHSKIEYLKTTGIAGYVRRYLSYKRNWISLLAAILSIWIYSNIIWNVEVQGEGDELSVKLVDSMRVEGIEPYAFLVSTQKIRRVEEQLKEDYFDEIEWLNMEHNGSSLSLHFRPRKKAIREPLGYEPLVARKEAVIAYFDVESGKKIVKVNDYVKVGDILVTSDLVDSLGKPKRTFVKGKVFGYTFVELEANLRWPYGFEESKPLAYFRILFHIRGKIAQQLSKEEHIESENILHFSHTKGTIRMKIQYTLYEDITKP